MPQIPTSGYPIPWSLPPLLYLPRRDMGQEIPHLPNSLPFPDTLPPQIDMLPEMPYTPLEGTWDQRCLSLQPHGQNDTSL